MKYHVKCNALRLYSTDLWTGTCVAKATRPKEQRVQILCLRFRPLYIKYHVKCNAFCATNVSDLVVF